MLHDHGIDCGAPIDCHTSNTSGAHTDIASVVVHRAGHASSASIVATLEPVIATFLGWVILGERLAWPQVVGAGLILAAVWILQRERS